MKRLAILLLAAAALAAAPAAAQTIKSLGFNTTNGQVVYSGTNPLTFTNPLQLSGGISGSTAAQEIIFSSGTNAITFSGNVGVVFFGNRASQFRTALGATTVGNAVFTATNDAAARTNLGGTLVGNAVFTATNAAAGATALGLGTTNSVTFGTLATGQLKGTSGTNIYVTLADDISTFSTYVTMLEPLDVVGAAYFHTNVTVEGNINSGNLSATDILGNGPATFLTNVLVGGTLTATGNVTLNGVGNTAPSQTASSGSSLMTRDLSDDRYSFSRWYDANDLLSGAQLVGVNPLINGNESGHIVSATLVTVSNVNTKFMLPVDYRVSGEVKVVSYWTDRGQTNSGTNGDIAVWSFPFLASPTNNMAATANNGLTLGTSVQNTFTANYGGSGSSRFYVMEQTLNFGQFTNISATNPMQLKWVELQRRGADASDTSGDNIYLSGVHIYVP